MIIDLILEVCAAGLVSGAYVAWVFYDYICVRLVAFTCRFTDACGLVVYLLILECLCRFMGYFDWFGF